MPDQEALFNFAILYPEEAGTNAAGNRGAAGLRAGGEKRAQTAGGPDMLCPGLLFPARLLSVPVTGLGGEMAGNGLDCFFAAFFHELGAAFA